MTVQEIIQLLETSKQSNVDFTDLVVKTYPHSNPAHIKRISFEGLTWWIYIDNDRYHLATIISDEILATVYQRLKLLLK